MQIIYPKIKMSEGNMANQRETERERVKNNN